MITQNGKATAVLQDVESFEEDRRAFALLKLALEGDAEIAAGQVLDARRASQAHGRDSRVTVT